MTRNLSVIGAPSSLGAYAPGQERAPAAWRAHGLVEHLAATGLAVTDRGDVGVRRWSPDRERPEAMNADGVAAVARDVAGLVSLAMADGDDVLVLGGDCTVGLGTVAGAVAAEGAAEASVALAYLDLDADLTVPATGGGAMDWMGVAHLLGVDGAVEELVSVGPRRPLLTGADVVLLGQDNVTDPEEAVIAAAGISVETLAAVHRDPAAAADRVVARASRHDHLLVHLDVDVLRWADFPIAENTRRRDGLGLEELTVVLERLAAAPNWRGLTICEVNPDHAPDEAESLGRLVEVVARVLSGRR